MTDSGRLCFCRIMTMNMQFDVLLKRISAKLKGITYNLKDHSILFSQDDLHQEALAHLWKSFKAGALEDKTDSYVLQGCYFHLKNYIRTHAKRINFVSLYSQYDNEDATRLEEAIADTFDKFDYLDCLSDKLLAEVIQNNGLSLREKEILSFYARGLTTREIGRELGISHVRVVKMTKCIREKCRKYTDNL